MLTRMWQACGIHSQPDTLKVLQDPSSLILSKYPPNPTSFFFGLQIFI